MHFDGILNDLELHRIVWKTRTPFETIFKSAMRKTVHVLRGCEVGQPSHENVKIRTVIGAFDADLNDILELE